MYGNERETLVCASTLGRNDIKSRLQNTKSELEGNLKEIEEAIEILENNPDFVKLVNALRNIGY